MVLKRTFQNQIPHIIDVHIAHTFAKSKVYIILLYPCRIQEFQFDAYAETL